VTLVVFALVPGGRTLRDSLASGALPRLSGLGSVNQSAIKVGEALSFKLPYAPAEMLGHRS
jgi:hypothetical protein